MSEAPRKSNYKPRGEVISNEGKLLTEAGTSPHMERQATQGKLHKGETARQGRQHSAGGAHKLHEGETARQGRQHSAGGAHKLHEGETARQGRQHSAEKRTSSAGRQERQLRKAGTRAAGSQKLRLWRSLF